MKEVALWSVSFFLGPMTMGYLNLTYLWRPWTCGGTDIKDIEDLEDFNIAIALRGAVTLCSGWYT